MSTVLEPDSFLRTASISIAGYDFLATLPVEWRLYHPSSTLRLRWPISRILFVLIRYISVILLVVSNVGYFYHGFSEEFCSKYYLVAPALKATQIMVSQAIVGYRTWNISQRSRGMGIFILAFGFAASALEWYASFDSRTPVQKDGNCSPGNLSSHVPQWVFYLVAMVFDVTTIALSSFFLIKSARSVSRMPSILKMLFYDGLVYIVFLTGVNVMNLILYRNSIGNRAQSSGSSFGYTVVWIMSQKIIIHIHEATETHTCGRFIWGTTGHGVTHNTRNVKDRYSDGSMSLDVQVQIERAVTVDYDLETRWKPRRGPWERKYADISNEGTTSADQGKFSSIIRAIETPR